MLPVSGKIIEKKQEGKSMRDWKNKVARVKALKSSELGGAMVKIRSVVLNDAGGALVEMAISSTLLLSMFFAVFEVGLGSYASHYVADAAREGARYAIVRGSISCSNTPNLSNCGASTDTIAAYVKGLPYPTLNPANMTVNVSYLTGTSSVASGSMVTTWATCSSGTCNQPGNMVNVQVTYSFPLLIPFAPRKTISLSSTSQMVVQQ